MDSHSVSEDGACVARFVLDSSAGAAGSPSTTVWYTVTLDASTLSTALSIKVDDSAQGIWKIRPGLHPYFLVRRNQVRIAGLQEGLKWDEGPRSEAIWEGGEVSFDVKTGR